MAFDLPTLRSRDTYAAALDEQLARSLRPIALVLAGLYATALARRALDPVLAASSPPTAVVPMLAFLLFGLLQLRRPLPARLANPVLAASLGLIAAEAVTSGPAVGSSHLEWALIGLGAVVLRPRWAVVAAAAVIATWLAASVTGVAGWRLTDWGFDLEMAGAAAIGTVVYLARRRATLGLVSARWDLHNLALSDALTGLRNRRGLEHAAHQAFLRDPSATLAIVYVDLDGFKAVNDRLGHAEGDRALIAVAGILRTTFRAADVISRVGGDEFVVLVAPGSDVAAAADRLEARLAGWHDAEDRYDLRASIGTGEVTGGTLECLWAAVADADARMYEAKQRRRCERAHAGAGAEAQADDGGVEIEAVA